MTGRTTARQRIFASAAAIAIGAGMADQAQAQEPAPPMIEEIIVTATRRAESLQDVGFSVSAVAGDKLTALGAEGFSTFANRVPGLNLIQAGPNDTQLVMRGVHTSKTRSDRGQQRATVGLYIDDVPISVTSADPNGALLDMERIEVLRGPQGTLFGAGALSGVIRYVTAKPDPAAVGFGGGVNVGWIDDGGMMFDAHGILNLPLVQDKLAVRGLVYYRDADGYTDNVKLGINDTNDNKSVGGRASLLWTVTDSVTVNAFVDLFDGEIGDRNVGIAGLGDRLNKDNEREPAFDNHVIASLTGAVNFSNFDLISVTSYFDKKQEQYIDTVAFAFISAAVSDSLVAGGILPGRLTTPGLPSIFPLTREDLLVTNTTVENFTQELRLQSTHEGPLQWIGGLFYQKAKRNTAQVVAFPGIEADGLLPGFFFGAPTDNVFFFDADFNDEQFAAFGELSYELATGLTVTAGLRYFDASQDSVIEAAGLLREDGAGTQIFKNSENGVNPRFNLTYEFDDSSLVFAQAAKGFRLGGPNVPVSATCNLGEIGLARQPQTFESDSLWNYELGAKTSLFGGRMTANLSGFYIDWKNIQLIRDLTCGSSVFINAGTVKVKGIEGEFTVRATEYLSLFAGFAFTDSELGEAVATIGNKGDRTPYVPRWTASFSADVDLPLSDRADLFGSVEIQYVGERYSDFRVRGPLAVQMEDYALLNLRIGAQIEGWRVMAYVDNLTNRRAVVDARQEFLASTAPNLELTYARPRTVGVSITRPF